MNLRRFDSTLILCAAFCWCTTILFWAYAPEVERDPSQLEALTSMSKNLYRPEHDLSIYVGMCIASLVVTTLAAYVCLYKSGLPQLEPTTKVAPAPTPLSYMDLAFVLLLFAAIWIPNARLLLEQSFLEDRFHHLNYYILGPLQMYQHGAALGTDAYTQYQSGWVLLFAALGNLTTVDHALVIEVLSFVGAFYFIAWFCVLRKLGFNSSWAALCILICLMLQHFLVFQSNVRYTLWTYPSSTVCRNPTDVFVLGSLLYLFETNKLRYALCAGFFVGLGLLFGNDTGIYVSMAALGACLLRLFDPNINRRQTSTQCAAIILSALAIALTGLVIASRGTLLQADFWTGYYEALQIYSSGFSAKRIKVNLVIDRSKTSWSFLFLGTLIIYTVAISRATALAFTGKASRLEPLYAFVGIVGFGTLILFINRSHLSNLSHVIVPAIVLWFSELLRFTAGENDCGWMRPTKLTNRVGLLLCAVCLFVLLCHTNFRFHASLLNNWTGNFSGESPSREYQKLVEQMPDFKRDIEQRLTPHSYALVGEDTTLWLMNFNQPSPTRYLPMLVVTRSQEEIMLRDLDKPYVIFCKEPKFVNDHDLRQAIERKYTLFESTPYYDIYSRNGLPLGEPKPNNLGDANSLDKPSK